jgi:hypothetical protein
LVAIQKVGTDINFKGSSSNGIESKSKSLAKPAEKFQVSEYSATCPQKVYNNMVRKVDETDEEETSFIQTNSMAFVTN